MIVLSSATTGRPSASAVATSSVSVSSGWVNEVPLPRSGRTVAGEATVSAAAT